MKKLLFVIVALLVTSFTLEAQNDPDHGYFRTLTARNAFTNYGTLTQSGIATFTAANSFTGTNTFKRINVGSAGLYLYPLTVTNYGETLEFAADTVGMVHGTAYLASVDSFSTTSTSKVITWTGATVGDPVIVTPLTPAYSATPDTGCAQYAAYVTAGGGSVTVFRYLKAAGSTYKSGGQFNVMLIARH
jgi:hypothetical protein